MQEFLNKVIHGDCLEELKKLPDNSMDSVVCDPPYGLSKEPDIYEVLTKWMNGEDYHHRSGGFMGKSWDSFVPGPSIWREVYRVLKPGGHLLCFAGTRTQDLMTISLRLAGFEIRDVIEYLYFSGFPKSLDVGKAFDRRRTEDLPAIYAVTKFIADARDRAGKTNRDIDEFMGTNGMAGHWTTQGSQPQVPKLDQWYKLKEFLGMSDEMDEEVWRLNGRKGKPGDAWFEREKIGENKTKDFSHHKGSMMSKETTEDWSTKTTVIDITTPATDLAKKWDGWHSALKPAHEPIILARKKLDGTICNNVEKWGCGAINVDGCRIKTDEFKAVTDKGGGYFLYGGFSTLEELKEAAERGEKTPDGRDAMKTYLRAIDKERVKPVEKEGRFPANCVTLEPDQFYSKYFNITPPELSKKANKKDRNSDWRGEEINIESKRARVAIGNRTCVNCGRSELDGRRNGRCCDNPKYENMQVRPVKNHHPTTKPIMLMSWLIKLICPPGGIVLDPFAGSGSTLVAAKREGFNYIGIEKEAEYVEIAKVRVGQR